MKNKVPRKYKLDLKNYSQPWHRLAPVGGILLFVEKEMKISIIVIIIIWSSTDSVDVYARPVDLYKSPAIGEYDTLPYADLPYDVRTRSSQHACPAPQG